MSLLNFSRLVGVSIISGVFVFPLFSQEIIEADEVEISPINLENSEAKQGGDKVVPEALKPWIDWVLRNDKDLNAPRNYQNAEERLTFWPSQLRLEADSSGAKFSVEVEAFAPSWFGLPGDEKNWPQEVKVGVKSVPIVARDKRPTIFLETGKYQISGQFSWKKLPNELLLPSNIGLLTLTLDGKEVISPQWNAQGRLHFRSEKPQTTSDSLQVKTHTLLRDGVPLEMETRLELIVSGSNREVSLGTSLPEGWQLAGVSAPLPVAVNEQGEVKAQVRAGRWEVVLQAFHVQPAQSISFAESVTPIAESTILAFQSNSQFRRTEIEGLVPVDGSQTQAPAEWRQFPLYQWPVKTAFQLKEQLRGSGEARDKPLEIQRALWLDADGSAYTFVDQVTGGLTASRRLNMREAWSLGFAELNSVPQLVTLDAETGTAGVELRSPQVKLSATGRVPRAGALSATGWDSDATVGNVNLQLPPGYRLLAATGVDFSHGDWLTAWTLLDLFLVLLFVIAVYKLCGWKTALVGLLALVLTFHEPGAPRFAWFILLIPVALTMAVAAGKWARRLNILRWAAAIILLLYLIPFSLRQIQAALYPQLENTGLARDIFPVSPEFFDFHPANILPGSISFGSSYAPQAPLPSEVPSVGEEAAPTAPNAPRELRKLGGKYDYRGNEGLSTARGDQEEKVADWNDPKAAIQTGPGLPAWQWRKVSFGWDGPVAPNQSARLFLCPPWMTRCLELAQVLALVALLGLLMRRVFSHRAKGEERSAGKKLPAAAAPMLLALTGLFFAGGTMRATADVIPNSTILNELREYLTDPGEAFPGAADLAAIDLQLGKDNFQLKARWHAADRCAVPLPIPLSVWHIVEAKLGGESAHLLRKEGRLWTLLPSAGIHEFFLQGRLDGSSDWEWNLDPIKPHQLRVDAPDWEVNGLHEDGRIANQLLFSPEKQENETDADDKYDQPETRPVLRVTRRLNLGLTWQVRTTVERLSRDGRTAVATIPLLPGEKITSRSEGVEEGAIRIQLAPHAKRVSWESELSMANELTLSSREDDSWTERWQVMAAPIWNVKSSGLTPIFIASGGQLAPFWQAWPGESTTLRISRPAAVVGPTITIDKVDHTLKVGQRRHSSELKLKLRSSLGGDFPIELPSGAEISSLKLDGRVLPVHKSGDVLAISLHPGEQELELNWELPSETGFVTKADSVKLPLEAVNLTTTVHPGGNRWLLLPLGSGLGPVFRLWQILAFSFALALALHLVPGAPLRFYEWILLMIGLTQAPVIAGLFVVGWLFAILRWRGTESFHQLPPLRHNVAEVVLIGLTLIALGTFVAAIARGLLAEPALRVMGYGSTSRALHWFSDRSMGELPTPGYLSISIWWYRLAMLIWALWIALKLVLWLRLGWQNSASNGHFKNLRSKKSDFNPPPLPD